MMFLFLAEIPCTSVHLFQEWAQYGGNFWYQGKCNAITVISKCISHSIINSLSNCTNWKRVPTQLWPSRAKMRSSTTKTCKWSAGWKLPPAICTRRKLSEDFATFILDRSVSVDSNCPTTKTQYICFTGSLLRRHESLDEVLRCRHYGLPSPRMDLYDGCRPSRSLGRANWS